MVKEFEAGNVVRKACRVKRKQDHAIMENPKYRNKKAWDWFKRKPYSINLQKIQ